jgi:hypothetical protein
MKKDRYNAGESSLSRNGTAANVWSSELLDSENSAGIGSIHKKTRTVNIPPIWTGHFHVRDKAALDQVPPVSYMLQCL